MTVQGNLGRGSRCGGRASFQVAAHMDMTNLQRGIAIGPILFVVALLAILAVAISAGTGVFNGDTSAVKAKAQASAILEYANEVKFAVDRLLGKGCTDTQISFENPIVSGYVNPNAPSDKSCHVFDVNGGGISWKSPPAGVTTTPATGYSPQAYRYSGVHCVGGFGSPMNGYLGGPVAGCRSDASPPQLVMSTTDLTPQVCDALNTLLGEEILSSGHNNSSGVLSSAPFVGAYNKNAAGAFDAQATIGKMMGCARVNTAYIYFYSVLIPR